MEENDSIISEMNPTTIWEKKQTSSKEDCKLAPIAEKNKMNGTQKVVSWHT